MKIIFKVILLFLFQLTKSKIIDYKDFDPDFISLKPNNEDF